MIIIFFKFIKLLLSLLVIYKVYLIKLKTDRIKRKLKTLNKENLVAF